MDGTKRMEIEFCKSDKMNVLYFQHNIYDFGNGHYEILDNDEFCKNLKQYMKCLFDLGHKEIVIKILNTLGACVVEKDTLRIRFKALAIVSSFSSLLMEKKDNEFFRKVVNIMTAWFAREQGYHAGYATILSQIKVVIRKMFSLKLWEQVESLLIVSREIISGSISTGILFKREVCKLHNDVADISTINSLIASFLTSKDQDHTSTCNVLKAMTPHSSGSMIHCLFKCGDREKRLKLLEMILEERGGILPVIVEKLRDKQPWYVVRNSMILLQNLQDPDLYLFARPFLAHPDSRVQREVLNCIVALGGDDVYQRLVGSISFLNDDVKEHLIDCLILLEDSSIEIFINDILEQRLSVPIAVREKLLVACGSTGKTHLSPESITRSRDMVMHGEKVGLGSKPALNIARKPLKNK